MTPFLICEVPKKEREEYGGAALRDKGQSYRPHRSVRPGPRLGRALASRAVARGAGHRGGRGGAGQRAARPHAPRRARRKRARLRLVLARVTDVAAAVLPPAVLGVVGAGGLFLAEAHGLDLALLRAQQEQRLLEALRTALAEADVVLAAAALVGVALDRHPGARVLAQVLRMRLDDAAVFVLQLEPVVVVVDRAQRRDAVRGLEAGWVARPGVHVGAGHRLAPRRLGLSPRCFARRAWLSGFGARARLFRGGSAAAEQQGRARYGDEGSAHFILPSLVGRWSPYSKHRWCPGKEVMPAIR